MADRIPLILNTNANQIQEMPSGDTLDLTGSNINGVGVITATTFKGDGSQLTGISVDSPALKDSGGNVKIQAQASGAVHTGISTFQDFSFSDVLISGSDFPSVWTSNRVLTPTCS